MEPHISVGRYEELGINEHIYTMLGKRLRSLCCPPSAFYITLNIKEQILIKRSADASLGLQVAN
jgi:hypothetical protein